MTILNADKFLHARLIYEISFHEIMRHIIHSYQLLVENRELLKNDENYIRDILVEKYLNNTLKRELLGIENIIFDREVAENMDKGFVDIKVQTANSLNSPRAYYIFECKRLDGSMDLNRKYINAGIMRFVSEKYSSYYSLNGILGFEVGKLDTGANIEEINRLAADHYPETNILKRIVRTVVTREFNFVYISNHKTVSLREIDLYHLMLDFSGVIKNE